MFKVGEFSKVAQVSARLLRHYDEVGVFAPAHTDATTGYRYYTAEQLPRLNQILALRDLGLSLEQIRNMLSESITNEEIRGMLRLQKAQLEQSISEQAFRLQLVETRLRYLEQQPASPLYDIALKTLPAQPFLSLRETVPMFTAGSILFMIHQAMPRHQFKQRGACTALFYGDNFDDQVCDWEVGFLMPDDALKTVTLSDGRELHLRILPPENQMVSTIYSGRWLGLHLGYSTLGEWIAQHGYQIKGIGREVFHQLHPPEHGENNVTEIQFPVEKIAV